MGCYAQARGGELERDPAIDLVIGNNRKKEIPDLLEACLRERRKHREVPDIGRERDYEPLRIAGTKEHTRAFLKVQDGCNQFCSYCIIPYTRGRVRSRDPQEVLREVQRLSVSGCREIVLSGIHLSSYGADFENGTGLLELIRLLHPVEGIARIRLGSLEPGIITERFAEQLSRLPKVCPHFHLSLQSGCDRTLRRMNRRYTSGEYLEKCRILRKYLKIRRSPQISLRAFPGKPRRIFADPENLWKKSPFLKPMYFPIPGGKGRRRQRWKNRFRKL